MTRARFTNGRVSFQIRLSYRGKGGPRLRCRPETKLRSAAIQPGTTGRQCTSPGSGCRTARTSESRVEGKKKGRFKMRNFLYLACLTGMSCLAGNVSAQVAGAGDWNPKAAAAYLDDRMSWWMNWPKSARDHETFCISCHTVAPYALGRAALRGALAEPSASPNEQKLLDNVTKRVRMWKEVEPFYADQTS